MDDESERWESDLLSRALDEVEAVRAMYVPELDANVSLHQAEVLDIAREAIELAEDSTNAVPVCANPSTTALGRFSYQGATKC